MNRARKLERFLSQPFFVAEAFTGRSGEYVPVADTVRSFREILEGRYDDLPESAFYMKGSIDQVTGTEERARRTRASSARAAEADEREASARPRRQALETEAAGRRR